VRGRLSGVRHDRPGRPADRPRRRHGGPGPRRAARRLLVACCAAAVLLAPAAVTPSTALLADAGAVRATLGTVEAEPLLFRGGVGAGEAWSLGWDADGRLFAWGSNHVGQLGTGSTVSHETRPTRVLMPDGLRVVQASAGIDLGIALTDDGGVWAWGNPDIWTNTDVPQRVAFFDDLEDEVVGVDAGGYYYLARTGTGALYSWGVASHRLGRPFGTDRDPPARVTAQGLDSRTVVTASAGRFHGAAVTTDGVAVWGADVGDTAGSAVTGLPDGDPVVGVSAGARATLLWTASGRLLGTTSRDAEPVQGLVDVVGAVVSSPVVGLPGQWAWDGAGRLWAWGSNAGGQLGIGEPGGVYVSPQPVELAPGSTAAAVAGGGAHALYEAGSGTFAAAGSNEHGQLGDGTTTPRTAFRVEVPVEGWPAPGGAGDPP
jgi:alpha-tubulin suppressor-like RCC1 family protein